jgi:catechol 2,3-dioxygenase-like lactoylglutathione lyase family enzyme
MRLTITCLVLLFCGWVIYPVASVPSNESSNITEESDIQLGNFSISLNVKDLKASKEFYEKLGFKVFAGNLKSKYVILQNDTSTIGLFNGMLEKNSLTFNPGWDRDTKTLAEFQDVRDIQKELKKRGLEPVLAADESTSGPAFMTLVDPDGNPILIDQHVPRPKTKE